MGCFRCESWNGSNPECEDTFNSTAAFLKGFYEQNCMSYMKSRNGLYPATACVKIKGKISKFLHFLNIKIGRLKYVRGVCKDFKMAVYFISSSVRFRFAELFFTDCIVTENVSECFIGIASEFFNNSI